MSKLPCPHCKEETISWWQKYKLAKWALIQCSSCGRRICSQPFVCVIYTMLYVWDVMLFGTLFYLKKDITFLIALVVFWIILDIFSLYLPINAMKRKNAAPDEKSE